MPEFEVAFGRSLCLLSERVQHVDALGECGNIEHAMLADDVNPNFANTGADRGHGLPIVRLEALLHAAELKPSLLSGLRRKRA